MQGLLPHVLHEVSPLFIKIEVNQEASDELIELYADKHDSILHEPNITLQKKQKTGE